MFQNALGRILHIANSDPPSRYRREFYAVKDRVLKRFGLPECNDLQHIIKPCWRCDGTGTFRGYDNGIRWVNFDPFKCRKCGGSGVYDEFWVALEGWSLGRYRFHRPRYRTRSQADPQLTRFAPGPLFDNGALIEGHIVHDRHRRAGLCANLLFFLFDLHTFSGIVFYRPISRITKHFIVICRAFLRSCFRNKLDRGDEIPF